MEGYIKVLQANWCSKHGERYAKRYTGQISTLRNWAEFAGANRAVKTLNRDDFIFYVEHEAKRGLKPSSIARHINEVRAALYHAIETHPDPVNHRLSRRPPMRKRAKGKCEFSLKDEIKALSSELADKQELQDALDFFSVALGTGARFDEILPIVERADRAAAFARN